MMARRPARVALLALFLALPATATVAVAQQPGKPDSRVAEIARLREQMPDVVLPRSDSITTGNRTVPAGSLVKGSIAISGGRLEVLGTVDGSVAAIGGDVIIGPSARVTGNAVSIGGHVIRSGGVLLGESRSLDRVPNPAAAAVAAAATVTTTSTWQQVKIVAGWFGILFLMGVGVLMMAEPNLQGVVREMERHLPKSFWVGLLAQLAALPLLLLLCVGLVLTIVGALLVPFAIVAYVVVVAGLLALGFLGVAQMTGSGILGGGGAMVSTRSHHLRALFVGLFVYLGLWLFAALGSVSPVVGSMLRSIALAVTWAATTIGLGSVILSRAGTQRSGARARTRPADELAWSTPTPVAGVAAARRPVTVGTDAR
ncbi:MAG: hypothetical protein JWO05_3492 [Gemmatimonadetes bacterium]|nr:hypothetical protein [Gemmatimonadota bacterium]